MPITQSFRVCRVSFTSLTSQEGHPAYSQVALGVNVSRVGCNWGVRGTRVLGIGVVRVENSRGASREQARCVSGTHPDTRVGNTCLL